MTLRPSRRSVIAALASSGVVLAVSSVAQKAAAAESTPVTITPSSDFSEVKVITDNFSAIKTLNVPAAVLISPLPAAGTTLRTRYDHRIFKATDLQIVSFLDDYYALPTIVRRLDESTSEVEVSLPDPVDGEAGTWRASAPISVVESYPNESIAEVKPLDFILTLAGGEQVPTLSLGASAGVEKSVWGAEIAVAFDDFDIGPVGSYKIPRSLVVKSVGPSAMPAGLDEVLMLSSVVVTSVGISSSVTISSDGPQFDSLGKVILPEPFSLSSRETFDEAGAAVVITMTTEQEVASGRTLQIDLMIENESQQPSKYPAVLPVATLTTAAAGASSYARTTGRYSVAAEQSSISSANVSVIE